MEIAEQVYEGVTPAKISTHRADDNHASHGRKHKGGEANSPNNTGKGSAGKCKNNHVVHPSDRLTGDKTCVLNGSIHSMEECKVLK